MASPFQGRVAFASIVFNGGVPSYRTQSGDFGAITDHGPGDVTLALVNQIDPDEACASLTLRTVFGLPYVFTWTDTGIRIQIDDGVGGGLTDIDFDLIVVVRPSN